MSDTLRLIFQAILLVIAVYHIIKHQYKEMKAVLTALLLSFLPVLLDKLVHINVDAVSAFLFYMILIMSLYFGSSLGFYDRFKWWDRLVHFLSGAAFIGFGIAIADNSVGVSNWLALLFSFTFSVALHVFWEVLEYVSDCITRGNAQRWQFINTAVNHVSAKAIQPAGLVDTMNDFICCITGSVLAVIVWWIVWLAS